MRGGPPTSTPDGPSWFTIFENWECIPPDLLQTYGVDLQDPNLDHRSWVWLQDLILGLLSTDSRLHRALTPTT